MMGRVEAVHRAPTHEFSKQTADRITLVPGLGVAGDAHQGARVKHRSRVAVNPDQPNLRQVHLFELERLRSLADQGFPVSPGKVGENITTEGLDLTDLPLGTLLRFRSGALIAITGLRNPCAQLDALAPGLMAACLDRSEGRVLLRAGVMAVVIGGGDVAAGDSFEPALPPAPFRALDPV
ncbi:MAG: MOSC domain-containing protein [Pseudomonadota bacterium]